MLELEDRQRVLALEDAREDRRDRPRRRQPTPSGPPIALGDRAASSGARRPETLEEKRARFEKQYRKKNVQRWKDEMFSPETRAELNRSARARRVREQQFISAAQG